MTDVTQQLLGAVRKVLDMRKSSFDGRKYLSAYTPECDALHEMDEARAAYEASRAAPDDVVAWGALSYFEKIRRLPAPDAAQLLDALLDRMWVNGAQAGQSERDALQAAAFERHVSDRRREANAAIAALSALPAPADDGPSFGPLDPRVHDLGTWEPARDDALEALRELSERATKGKAWHAIEGHVFSYIVDEHVVAEKHIAATSPSDAPLIAAAVNYVRTKLAAPAQEPRS